MLDQSVYCNQQINKIWILECKVLSISVILIYLWRRISATSRNFQVYIFSLELTKIRHFITLFFSFFSFKVNHKHILEIIVLLKAIKNSRNLIRLLLNKNVLVNIRSITICIDNKAMFGCCLIQKLKNIYLGGIYSFNIIKIK